MSAYAVLPRSRSVHWTLKSTFACALLSGLCAQWAATAASPEPFFGLYVNVPVLRADIEKRVPSEARDARFHMANGMAMSLGAERAFVFLYPGGEHFVYPVILLQTSNPAGLESFLAGEGPLAPMVEKIGDGVYQFKPLPAGSPDAADGDAAPAGGPKSPVPPELFRIQILGKGAIVAPIPLIEAWDQGAPKPMQTGAMKTIMGLATKEDVAVLALHIPEDLGGIWEETIMKHQALEQLPKDMGTAMVMGMAGAVFAQIVEPFAAIESLGVGFRFKDETGRRLRYAQVFREGVDGAAIHEQLTSGKIADPKAKGVVAGLVRALQDEKLTSTTSFENNRLVLDLSWDGADDKQILEKLGKATVGQVMRSKMMGSSKPTEGPITPEYEPGPEWQTDVDVTQIEAVITEQIEANLFASSYFANGDSPSMSLELDPITVPNGALANVAYEVKSITSPDGEDVMRKKDEDRPPMGLMLGSTHPAHLRLETLEGTPAEKLGKATIAFTVTLPATLEIVEFQAGDAKDTVKASGDVEVTLGQLEGDVASVSAEGGESLKLFAKDATGQYLATKGGSWSQESASMRFRGVIQTLETVVVTKMQEIVFELEVDLNGGKRAELPQEPTDAGRARYLYEPFLEYASYTEEDMQALEVVWHENPESSFDDGLIIWMPKAPFSGDQFEWSVNLFTQDQPMVVKGHGWPQDGKIHYRLQGRAGLAQAHAAFGRTKLQLNSGIERLTFRRGEEGQVLEQALPDGQAIKVLFEKNQIAFDAGPVRVLQFAAFDSDARQLKADQRSNMRDRMRAHYYWGKPATFVMDMTTAELTRIIDFEIKKRPVDEEAYAAYKERALLHQEIAGLLKTIDQARHKAHFVPKDDLAQYFFLHDQNGDQMKQIDEAIAKSDPAGAERFNYTPEPYKGYHFSVLKGETQGGEEKPYGTFGDEKDHTWEGGTFKAISLQQMPVVVARPVDKTQPTFIFMWGSAWQRVLGDETIEYTPENIHGGDWVQTTIITEE